MAGPSIPSFGNFLRKIFPRLPEFSPDYAYAVSDQITLNPHDLFTLTQDLAIDAAPFSKKLGQDCLGIQYENLLDADGKVSRQKVEELRELCHNLKKCVDARLEYCKQGFFQYLNQYRLGRLMPFREEAKGIPIENREEKYHDLKEDATLNEQYIYFSKKLKEKMDQSLWQSVKDLFKRPRRTHKDAVGQLYYTADHLFETEQMEKYWERAARHYMKAAADQVQANPDEYINTVLMKDSVNVKRLNESIKSLDYLLDHFYLPAARTHETSNGTVRCADRLRDINNYSMFQVSESEFKTVEDMLEPFQQWMDRYPVLKKSMVFSHLVDRYIKSSLYAAHQRKRGAIQITDYGQRYCEQKLGELAAIASNYYPNASQSVALTPKQEKACLKALYKHAKRISGELMRQSKSDSAEINTVNHGFQVTMNKSAPNRKGLAALDAMNSYKAYVPFWLWPAYDKLPDSKKVECAKALQGENDALEEKHPEAFRPFLKSIHVNNQQAEALLADGLAYPVKGVELACRGLLKAIGVPFLLIDKIVTETPAYMSVWADSRLDDNGTILNMPATFREAGLNTREEVAKKFQAKMKAVEGFYRMISLVFQYYRMIAKLQGNIMELNGQESPDDPKILLLNYCAYNVTGLLLQPTLRRSYIDKALHSAIDYVAAGMKNGSKPDGKKLNKLMGNIASAAVMDVAWNVCNQKNPDDRKRECGRVENSLYLLRTLAKGNDALLHKLLNEGRLLSQDQVEKVFQCFLNVLEQDRETATLRFKPGVVKYNAAGTLSVEEFMRGVIATCFLNQKNQTGLGGELDALAQKVQNVTVNDYPAALGVGLAKKRDAAPGFNFSKYCDDKLAELKKEYCGKEDDLEYHAKRIAIAEFAKQHELYNLQHNSAPKNYDKEKKCQEDLEELAMQKRQLLVVQLKLGEDDASNKTVFSQDSLIKGGQVLSGSPSKASMDLSFSNSLSRSRNGQ